MNGVNWLLPPPAGTLEAACRIRYRHNEVSSLIRIVENDSVTVHLSVPQTGVTPGQAAVFYHGDEVIGGGWIDVGAHSMRPGRTPSAPTST